jgi:hypothetical protein
MKYQPQPQVELRDVAEGLWIWRAEHPHWRPNLGWEPRCIARPFRTVEAAVRSGVAGRNSRFSVAQGWNNADWSSVGIVEVQLNRIYSVQNYPHQGRRVRACS